MQAYQSAPCPYCGVTWNPPGAQACGNCRNGLPPAPPAYAPPGYPPPAYPQPGNAVPAQQPQPPYAYPGQPQAGGYAPQPTGQGPYAYPPAGYQPGAPYPPPQPPYAGYAPQALAAPGAAPYNLQLFGRSFALPFVIPAILVPYQRYLLLVPAAVAVLVVLLVGVTPALAGTQIDHAQRSIKVAVSHQAKVDAAFARFFSTQAGSSDPNTEKATLLQEAKAFNDALASVQSDEAALRSTDQSLSLLQPVTPLKSSAITVERHRIAVALTGLGQADRALTAAVNESNVALPYIDALIDYAKMGAALGKHDLVGAGAPYPDAQQKVELAMSLDHAAGLSPAIAKQVSSFNDALNSTEALIQALQAKDTAAIRRANDSIQAAVKAMGSPAESVAADYESKTFSPMQKAYDSALKTLKS
jgi:hypothetical protein